jgi:transcription initiation factor IIE alpha subunit
MMRRRKSVYYVCPSCHHAWESVRYGHAFCPKCRREVTEHENGKSIDQITKAQDDADKLAHWQEWAQNGQE